MKQQTRDTAITIIFGVLVFILIIISIVLTLNQIGIEYGKIPNAENITLLSRMFS